MVVTSLPRPCSERRLSTVKPYALLCAALWMSVLNIRCFSTPCVSLQAVEGVSLKAGLQASLLAMFDAAMFKAWPLAKSVGISSSSVRKCADYNNGDFQCNAAMSLFKALKVSRMRFDQEYCSSIIFCCAPPQVMHVPRGYILWILLVEGTTRRVLFAHALGQFSDAVHMRCKQLAVTVTWIQSS